MGELILRTPEKPMSQWQELGIYELNIGSEGTCISYISKIHIQYKYYIYIYAGAFTYPLFLLRTAGGTSSRDKGLALAILGCQCCVSSQQTAWIRVLMGPREISGETHSSNFPKNAAIACLPVTSIFLTWTHPR